MVTDLLVVLYSLLVSRCLCVYFYTFSLHCPLCFNSAYFFHAWQIDYKQERQMLDGSNDCCKVEHRASTEHSRLHVLNKRMSVNKVPQADKFNHVPIKTNDKSIQPTTWLQIKCIKFNSPSKRCGFEILSFTHSKKINCSSNFPLL